jgi:hypothetical protein
VNYLRTALPLVLTLALAACGGGTPPPVEQPPAESPVTPSPITPIPISPEPPEQPVSDVPYYGEWIIDYTSDVGVSFRHALQVTTDVSDEGLLNAGGGLQEFCTGGDIDEDVCEGVYGSGFGFIGELVLDDGTQPLSMAIATQYGFDDPELKIFTVDEIVLTKDGEGRDTFTTRAAWVLNIGDLAPGTITATKVGPPRTLDPLVTDGLGGVLRDFRRFAR